MAKDEALKQESQTPTEKSGGGITLEYPKAPMSKRMISILLDFVCVALVGLGCFVLVRLAMENSSWYNSAYESYMSICEQSHLYYDVENSEGLTTMLTYVENATDEDGNALYTTEEQNDELEECLTHFYNSTGDLFFSISESDEEYSSYSSWRETRASYGDVNLGYGAYVYYNQKIGTSAYTYDGTSYFLLNTSGEIVVNSALDAEALHNFYVSASDQAQSYLANNDTYVEAARTLLVIVNFVAIPISLFTSCLIFYFLIPLIFFRRGYQTLGMRPFHLYLLNAHAISPSFRAFLGRTLILFFVEIVGSLVTFGIPLIVSFSMLAFRKDGQCLHDYLSGTYMVDAADQSVYVSYDEYLMLRKKFESTEASNDLLLTPNPRGAAVEERKKDSPANIEGKGD